MTVRKVHFTISFVGPKAEIEALTGLTEGINRAYATDKDEIGSYNGASWVWVPAAGWDGDLNDLDIDSLDFSLDDITGDDTFFYWDVTALAWVKQTFSWLYQYILGRLQALTTLTPWLVFLDEDDMASNSNTKVASQQSIKAYVDSRASIQLVTTHGQNGQVDASDTDYLMPYDMGTGFYENASQIIVPACTIKNLRVSKGTVIQPSSGDLVFSIYKNGVATALTVTITNGDGAPAMDYADTTNEVSFADGDKLTFGGANAATAASATIRSVSCEMHIPTT